MLAVRKKTQSGESPAAIADGKRIAWLAPEQEQSHARVGQAGVADSTRQVYITARQKKWQSSVLLGAGQPAEPSLSPGRETEDAKLYTYTRADARRAAIA